MKDIVHHYDWHATLLHCFGLDHAQLTYKRNGTATLFAAMSTLDGSVISMCDDRHRHQEWLKFLRVIDNVMPADKQLDLIADNYAVHKHPKVQKWLARHPPLSHVLHADQQFVA